MMVLRRRTVQAGPLVIMCLNAALLGPNSGWAEQASPPTRPRKIDVTMSPFGAVGDGFADDTVPIQSALDMACAQRSRLDYWSPSSVPAVYVPPGNYTVRGVDIRCPLVLEGDGPSAAMITLRANSNRSVIRTYAERQDEPPPHAQLAQSFIRNLSLDGNKGAQSADSHGIEFVDADYSIGVRYAVGARIENVNIVSTHGDGIYIGKNRNFGFIQGVIVQNVFRSGIHFVASYDWQISNSSIGANENNGITAYYSGAIAISNTAIYNNKMDGILFQESVGSYFWITACTIGANLGNGINIAFPSVQPSAGSIGLNNVHLADNSLGRTNSSSHVVIRNFKNLMLSNIFFQTSDRSRNSRFLIDNDSVSAVQLSNLTFSAIPPFATDRFRFPGGVRSGAASDLSGTP